MVDVKGYTNGDDCFLAWIEPNTPGLRGFEIRRSLTRNGKTNTITLDNYVGFAKDHPKPNERRSSTTWPFQRYTWTDHGVDEGDVVDYTVTPMLESAAGGLAPDATRAGSSGPLHVTSAASTREWAVFNRGIVLSQFMTRKLPPNFTNADLLKLKNDLAVDDNELRRFLTGQLGARLFRLLDDARTNGWHIYAALYELDDDRLINALLALGQNAHVVLSNGSLKTKPGDGNARAAGLLQGNVDLTRRMLWSAGLGHNKFVVVARTPTDPIAVWTGSTNWAPTGLCTQMNNALLVRSAALARTYLDQWHRLHDDEAVVAGKVKHFLAPLMASNDQPKSGGTTASGKWTAWFTRTSNRQDIAAASEVINGAEEAILFLMFEPGSNGLRQVVEARMTPGTATYRNSLYIHGVVNTLRPGGKVDSTTVARGDQTTIDLRVVEPEGVASNLAEWAKEVTRRDFIMGQGGVIGHAIIHSKVIVVDPFTKPVVITGSHNFSTPASEDNDENLLIIRGSRPLAERYAVNIMSTYQHYRWRAYLRDCAEKGITPWSALADDDAWQKKLPEHNPELAFWLGL